MRKPVIFEDCCAYCDSVVILKKKEYINGYWGKSFICPNCGELSRSDPRPLMKPLEREMYEFRRAEWSKHLANS